MAYQVYLDTNILSRLQDERITLEGAESLLAIARHPEVCLLVSRYTRAELESAVDPRKAALLAFFGQLLPLLQWHDFEIGGGIGDAIGSGIGGGSEDPLYTQLRRVFDPGDALHIFQAMRSRCSFFLTLDRRTILNRVAEHSAHIAELCPDLTFVDPISLLGLLEAH